MSLTGAWTIRLLDAAEADLARLDRTVARRVTARLSWLAEHTEEVRHAPLVGALEGLYKLRQGDWRVLYELLEGERVILVHAIGNRREIYRKEGKRR